MQRLLSKLATVGTLAVVWGGFGLGATREIADFEPAKLTFDRSVLNQATYGIYREPFDELQTRPYNLLFSNIGRHATLNPWQNQEGTYSRYLNALIGNNGTSNVDNDADAIQGSWIQRVSEPLAWGLSATLLAGSDNSDDITGSTSFFDTDDLSGIEFRPVASLQISERRVLGGGIRLTTATSEVTDRSFEVGVGGFNGAEVFEQMGLSLDFGVRQFHNVGSSWDAMITVGYNNATREESSETLDGTGVVTDRLVISNYEINDLSLGLSAGYSRLKTQGLGETEFRVGLERMQRELADDDLSYSESAGGITPSLTLLGQEPLVTTRLSATAKTIFQAGQTEVFLGGEVDYGLLTGSTQVDAAGLLVNEAVDDSQIHLGLTVGLRQPLFKDKLRFIVSGRADGLQQETNTIFDASTDGDSQTLTTGQYAIALEGVLANVTFDIAWLGGEEAPVEPVEIGVPEGSRRSVELDRLIFSAAVSW